MTEEEKRIIVEQKKKEKLAAIFNIAFYEVLFGLKPPPESEYKSYDHRFGKNTPKHCKIRKGVIYQNRYGEFAVIEETFSTTSVMWTKHEDLATFDEGKDRRTLEILTKRFCFRDIKIIRCQKEIVIKIK